MKDEHFVQAICRFDGSGIAAFCGVSLRAG
jgi:hypothetical protein